MRREASRVSFLMCPFCVRVVCLVRQRAFVEHGNRTVLTQPTSCLARLSAWQNRQHRKRGRMEFTNRETWTLIHPLILGTLFPLAFAGGLAGLWSLRTEYVTPAGISERLLRLLPVRCLSR